MTADELDVLALVFAMVDPGTRDLPVDLWTIGGQLLNDQRLAMVRSARRSDWRILHDLAVARAADDGLPSPCGPDCGWHEPEIAG